MRNAILLACVSAVTGSKLTPGYDIPLVNTNEGTVTVSGISSGAFMAVQMHVAFGLTIKGAGVLAGTSCLKGATGQWFALF